MNATTFCRLVEARLGWVPPAGPQHIRYRVEAAKVKHRIATNPELYTWRNLELAVELCVRERRPVKSALGVFTYVPRAVLMSQADEPTLELAIREASRIEGLRGDPDGWVVRFARAQGRFRIDALREWEATQ